MKLQRYTTNGAYLYVVPSKDKRTCMYFESTSRIADLSDVTFRFLDEVITTQYQSAVLEEEEEVLVTSLPPNFEDECDSDGFDADDSSSDGGSSDGGDSGGDGGD